MKKQLTNEMIDTILRDALGDRPRGAVSPFFATKTASVAKIETAKRRGPIPSRTGSTLLTIYWLTLLTWAALLLVPWVTSRTGFIVAMLVMPCAFGLAAFAREFRRGVLRVLATILR